MSDVDPADSGIASGIVNTSHSCWEAHWDWLCWRALAAKRPIH